MGSITTHKDWPMTCKIWLHDRSEANGSGKGKPPKSKEEPHHRSEIQPQLLRRNRRAEQIMRSSSSTVRRSKPREPWGFGQVALPQATPAARNGWEGDGLGILRFWKVPGRGGAAWLGVVGCWGEEEDGFVGAAWPSSQVARKSPCQLVGSNGFNDWVFDVEYIWVGWNRLY